jgi:hypothetical protein
MLAEPVNPLHRDVLDIIEGRQRLSPERIPWIDRIALGDS